MGATDVVPFIPLEGTTMEDCIALARTLGERVGSELEIPVFLYERAATRPVRENLADIRRGEFEGIRDEIGTAPRAHAGLRPRTRASDGGRHRDRRAAVSRGVQRLPRRRPSNLDVAKHVAKAVRGSSGGLRYVKGLGLEVDGQAQVSMNLVDIEKTPVYRAFDMVKMEAEAEGVTPTWSEIVGLVPERALFETAARHLQLRDFTPDMVLEHKVREAVGGGISLSGFVGSVASSAPVPGGGSVAAHVGALGAALAQMVAGLTAGRKKYAAVDAEMREVGLQAAALVRELSTLVDRDAESYAAVSAAYKLPRETDAETRRRADAITEALLGAADVPLESARACVRVCELAATVAAKGNTNAVSDAGVAALLAEAACQGAAYNVRINVASLDDRALGKSRADEAAELVRTASALAAQAVGAVEAAIGG